TDMADGPALLDIQWAFEWQALLAALDDAAGTFTMLELGAGIGLWTVRAAAAARRYQPGLRHRFVAVEAEPTHYRWAQQHTRDSGLGGWSRAGRCKLVRAAVTGRADGQREEFFYGDPASWYGQTLVRPENSGWQGPRQLVRTVTLRELLDGLDHV